MNDREYAIRAAVYQTSRLLSPSAVAHLREIEAADVALARSTPVDEWPQMADAEYLALYED